VRRRTVRRRTTTAVVVLHHDYNNNPPATTTRTMPPPTRPTHDLWRPRTQPLVGRPFPSRAARPAARGPSAAARPPRPTGSVGAAAATDAGSFDTWYDAMDDRCNDKCVSPGLAEGTTAVVVVSLLVCLFLYRIAKRPCASCSHSCGLSAHSTSWYRLIGNDVLRLGR